MAEIEGAVNKLCPSPLQYYHYHIGMTKGLQLISIKLPSEDLRRIPTENRSDFIREAVGEKLDRQSQGQWTPQSRLGRRLLALSDRFAGDRLDAEGIAEELRQRRGGLA
jgi:Arc/MetJ-type ribon-helix-helix transcriptional regulator